MARPYARFPDRVGAELIKPTSAGYLPLPDAEVVVARLGRAEDWYGKSTASHKPRPYCPLTAAAAIGQGA
jgi:hypothetical protein